MTDEPSIEKGGDIMSEEQTREIRIILPEELFSFLCPKKTMGHIINAKKEMLFALRSLIDARVEALEKMEEKTRQKSTSEKRKKIKIE
jgi:hypothetical protein